MDAKIEYIVSRLKERSTWLGIVAAAAVFGFKLEPDQAEAIVELGVAAACAIMVFTKD